MLSFAAICPHPPIIIPSIGKKETIKVKNTINAMKKLADDFTLEKISTAVVISPHGPVDWHKMTVNTAEPLHGSFLNFGDNTEMKFNNDIELAEKIIDYANRSDVPVEAKREIHLDHGTMVPLYFLAGKTPKPKIVPIAYSFLDYQTHFNFGKAIYNAVSESEENIAVIASGDLSHRLTPDAPAGYSKRGKEFDKKLIELLEKGKADDILALEPNLIEEAGECGLRSIIVLLGAMSELKSNFQKLSYEGPFGVGYLVGKFKIISLLLT